MKRLLALLFVIAILLTACRPVQETESREPTEAVKTELIRSMARSYQYEGEIDRASLTLTSDGKFSFSISMLSSYWPMGTYEESEHAIMLKTGDGKFSYTFRKDGNNLIFDGEKSSPMPKYAYSAGAKGTACVPDSAVFEETVSSFNYDSAVFDVDADGKEEACVIYMGPTSGLFTFAMRIEENGVLEYFNIFLSEYYELSYAKQDGKLKLKGVTQGDNPETHIYDILLNDGNVILERNGETLGYWGEQGPDSPYA